jgi:hypothetical protein
MTFQTKFWHDDRIKTALEKSLTEKKETLATAIIEAISDECDGFTDIAAEITDDIANAAAKDAWSKVFWEVTTIKNGDIIILAENLDWVLNANTDNNPYSSEHGLSSLIEGYFRNFTPHDDGRKITDAGDIQSLTELVEALETLAKTVREAFDAQTT